MGKHDPSPQERADIVVRQLEQFIRDGRTAQGGMNFKAWQEMARKEITDSIIADAKARAQELSLIKRMLLIAAAGVTTLGILGAALTLDRGVERRLGGLLLVGTGIVLFGFAAEWWGRKSVKAYKASRREEIMVDVEELERKIKRYESQLRRKAEKLEEKINGEG